jgi:hypothetical protein
MIGGLIAGGLGAALAAVAELLVLSSPDRRSADGRSVRVVAASFVAGEIALGVVIVMLTLTLPGTVDPAIGMVSAALLGFGSFAIAITYRGLAATTGELTARDRVGAIVRMAAAQGAGVIGAVIAILALMISAP